MAKKKKATRSNRSTTTRKAEKQDTKNGGILEYLRISESYTSLILGIVVVIIASVLLISFLKGNQFNQTPPPAPEISSAKIEPLVTPTAGVKVDENQGVEVTPTLAPVMSSTSHGAGTYTVQPGDDLWHIAEKVYNDGYKWTLIARANNITDPGMIFSGNVLKTPADEQSPMLSQSQSAQVTNQSGISGNSYKIEHGDTLWSIAQRRYKDGYRWVDIAKANNLTDPNLIHADNTLTLPQ